VRRSVRPRRGGWGRLEAAVVGQQQQPLAVPIEPPRRIYAGYLDELRQRRARRRRLRVGELAEDVVGFVEEDQAGHGGALAVFRIGFDRSCRFARLYRWSRGEAPANPLTTDKQRLFISAPGPLC
jgi:hypothetical protein